MIGAPAASKARANFSGVCPPYCTITPIGFSKSTISITSSNVTGSKYKRSEVSKSVDTVSGLQLIMMVS